RSVCSLSREHTRRPDRDDILPPITDDPDPRCTADRLGQVFQHECAAVLRHKARSRRVQRSYERLLALDLPADVALDVDAAIGRRLRALPYDFDVRAVSPSQLWKQRAHHPRRAVDIVYQ